MHATANTIQESCVARQFNLAFVDKHKEKGRLPMVSYGVQFAETQFFPLDRKQRYREGSVQREYFGIFTQ